MRGLYSNIIASSYAQAGTRIIQQNLLYSYDPGNTSSYPGSGTTYYDLQGNVNLTINGATYVSGGPWFDFDGINDDITSSTFTIPLTGDFSMGVWFRLDSTSGVRMFYSHADISNLRGAQIFWNAGANIVVCRVEDNAGQFASATIPTTLSVNTWYYCTLTWDTSLATVGGYLYGSSGLIASDTTANGSMNTSAGFTSCRTAFSDTYWTNGQMGEAHTYNALLSPAEMLQNYNTTKARYGY